MSEQVSQENKGVNIFSTTDISLAAYLQMPRNRTNVFKVIEATKVAGGKFQFRFEDPKGMADEVIMQYPGSEAEEFDASMKLLKRLAYR